MAFKIPGGWLVCWLVCLFVVWTCLVYFSHICLIHFIKKNYLKFGKTFKNSESFFWWLKPAFLKLDVGAIQQDKNNSNEDNHNTNTARDLTNTQIDVHLNTLKPDTHNRALRKEYKHQLYTPTTN